jgi:hypothetical protein
VANSWWEWQPARITCLLLQDIGTGTWREVVFHMLTATATPAGEAPSQLLQHYKQFNCRLPAAPVWCQLPMSAPNRARHCCDPAYSPLPWAMARLTWYGGVPMLLFSIACFYYCAMLTVCAACCAIPVA